MDESAPGAAFGGAAAQEWDPSTGAPMMNGSTAGAGATVGEWEMEQGHSRQATLVKPEEQGFFDGSFAYGQGQPAFAPQPPPQQATPQLLPPPTSIQLADVVAAIALLRNRLPIMEAALSTSPSDPGGDEEEIWKGVEGAYSELKRIIMCRKEARRGVLSRSGTLKASSNVSGCLLIVELLLTRPSNSVAMRWTLNRLQRQSTTGHPRPLSSTLTLTRRYCTLSRHLTCRR